MTFTIGADPETFVKKNGKAISVFETSLPGDKKAPHKTDYGAVQQDGMAAEFNINPAPFGDFETFNQNIVRTIADLRTLAGDVTLAKDVTVMDFEPEYMASFPEHVRELGCDPDFSAYTLEPNPRPDGEVNFRTAAGHVHVGWGADIPVDNREHMEICAGFVKMLDATVGMFMTAIDREPRRRELYGKAGAFRPKPYGVEYRTPSNMWIWNRDRRLVFHALVKKAITNMSSGYSPSQVAQRDEEEIVRIINEGDFVNAIDVTNHLLPTLSYYNSIGTASKSWQNIRTQLEAETARG